MTVDAGYEGLTLTGRFLSARQEDDRVVPSNDGGEARTYPGRFKATLLTGDRTVQVEYADEDAFLAAVGDVPASMDTLSLPVGVRSAKGYTFYFGRRA